VHDRCGGCQLQHLSYGAQLEAKRRVVADALARIGRRADVVVPPVVASPAAWRYRRKLTLALRRAGAGWIAGLHAYDDADRVFALDDCPITDERVLGVWRAVLAAAEWLPEDARALRGAVRLLADGAGADPGGRRCAGREASRRVRARGRASVGRGRAVLRSGPRARRACGGRQRSAARACCTIAAPWRSLVPRSYRSMPAVAALIAEHVVEQVLAHAPRTVIDAYAGAGDVAVRLAERGVRVTAIELDREAARWSAERLPPGSRSWAARVEERLAEALPADVIVVNPPRGGLHEQVPATLERAAAGAFGAVPRALLYVSCNPATLARDLARMPAWQVRRVQPFDMFPQTAHVETVVELLPYGGAPASEPARRAPGENPT
jgi:23S rRNA (uracil1939-C5)-methyltransferase